MSFPALYKSESVEFSLIESVICLFTDSFVQKYFPLTNQLIFTDWISKKKYYSLLNQLISTEVISEIWLIYSNLFLAVRISQISLIISRFSLIQIQRVVELGKFHWFLCGKLITFETVIFYYKSVSSYCFEFRK